VSGAYGAVVCGLGGGLYTSLGEFSMCMVALLEGEGNGSLMTGRLVDQEFDGWWTRLGHGLIECSNSFVLPSCQ
jgi:hypothetical protein